MVPTSKPCRELAPGALVGAYTIDRPVGVGGFADVYQARHTLLGKVVALKVVRESASTERERRGARLMCRLQHPNIVGVHCADLVDGRLVIAMDYVEGETLRDRLNRAGSLDVAEALRIAAAVCDGLSYVHTFDLAGATGFAHLDLKPSNVLMDATGQVKVTDFGLARVRRRPEEAGEPIAGSPDYMAPEQLAGDPSPLSDQWAIGVMLHEMITGEAPFVAGGSNGRRVRSTRFGAGIPVAVREVIERCLQEDPDKRFDSVWQLAEQLQTASPGGHLCVSCGAGLLSGRCPECTAVVASVAGDAHPGPPASMVVGQPGRWRLVALGLLIALMTGGAGYASTAGQGPQSSPELAWADVTAIEASEGGDYDTRLRALSDFRRRWPDSAEAAAAATRAKRWQDEADQFAAAEAYERRPATVASEVLKRWQTFVDGEWSGLKRQEGEARIAHWQGVLREFRGWARLTVLSATGLPAADLGLLGAEPPDPYFVLLVDGQVVYRSISMRDTPAPVWNESARVFLQPGAVVTVDVFDRNVFSDRKLVSFPLTSFKPDGPFSVAEKSIALQLELVRER